jgi:hypothetical protein
VFESNSFIQDLELSLKFIKTHISDCSSWSYRQWLIINIVGTQNEVSHNFDLIKKEVEFVKQMIDFYPQHECMWIYLRFLIEFGRSLIDISPIIGFCKGLDVKLHGEYPYRFIIKLF